MTTVTPSAAETEEAVTREMLILAARYAMLDEQVKEDQKEMKKVRAKLEQHMGLNDLDEIVDGETGLGVTLAREGQSRPTWDTRSMPAVMLSFLQGNGLLDVRTKLFNELKKAAPSSLLDEAEGFQIPSQTAPAFKAVKENK